jgi:hypothetical protein
MENEGEGPRNIHKDWGKDKNRPFFELILIEIIKQVLPTFGSPGI